MATGGSGDVLTGVLAALLAQGYEPLAAAQLGVYLHGLAGDLAIETTGMTALAAGDLVANLRRRVRSPEPRMRSWRSRHEAETREIGARLAAELEPDGVLLLTGDLGAGKTVLVQGLAAELGIDPAAGPVADLHPGARARRRAPAAGARRPLPAGARGGGGAGHRGAARGRRGSRRWSGPSGCRARSPAALWLEIRRRGQERSIRERRID